jgi:hypothetical protein
MVDGSEKGKKTMRLAPPRRGKVLRIFAILLVILIILGFLIPYLIPGKRLRDFVSKVISAQTNSVVRLDEVEFGWGSGLQIGGLDLTFKKGRSRIQVDRMNIPFEPIRLLTGEQLSFTKVGGVRISLEQGGEGISLSGSNGSSGQFSLPIRRMQISDLAIRFIRSEGYQNILRLPSLVLETDDKEKTTSFFGQARLEYADTAQSEPIYAGRFSLQGQMQIVQQSGQQCYAGTVKLGWQEVNLAGLRAEDFEHFDLKKLQGMSGGSLLLRIFPDFHFSWELDTSFQDMEIQRRGAPAPGRIDPLRLVTTGSHDPVTGNLEVKTLAINTSRLEFRSGFSAKIDDTGLALNGMEVSGNFNTTAVPQLIPAAQTFLGPEGKISGRCGFDFQWKGKQPVYHLLANIKADEVDISGSKVLAKPAGVPLNWTLAVQGDQSNWPWMTVEKFGLVFADLTVKGSGRLPRVSTVDNVDLWLEKVRKLGQIELVAQSRKVETIGLRIKPLQTLLSQANLTGPVTVRLGYAGQDQVGRTDLDINLERETTLAVKDLFVKPVGEKMDLGLQGFWPRQDRQPQVWFYFLGQCGRAQLLTPDRPVKLAWSFSKEDHGGRIRLDLAGSLAGEVRGVDQILSFSPRLKKARLDRRLGGNAELNLGGNFQLWLAESGWEIHNGRMHMDLNAGETWIDFPDLFLKNAQTPLSWTLDYRLNPVHRRHELTSVVKWQELVSRLMVTRSYLSDKGGPEEKLTGRYEIEIGDLSKTVEALPALSKGIENKIHAVGKVKGSCRWSSDAATDSIAWEFDGTQAGLVVDGREVKLPGIPASFDGGVNLPRSSTGQGQTYQISSLETRLGESFLRLKNGTFKRRNISGGTWLKMLGVEPWLAWRSSPIEDLDLNLSGRINVEDHLISISPSLAGVVGEYGLSGWTDFDVQARLNNNQLQTRIVSRLDKFGVQYKNFVNKTSETPGVLDLKLFAWPDQEDPKAYYCQIQPFVFSVGPVKGSGRGQARVSWADVRQMRLNDGQVQVTLEPLELSEMSAVSGIASKHRAEGRISARVVLERRNQENGLGASFVKFDQVGLLLQDQPVMVDGLVSFSRDFTKCDNLVFSAGSSSLQANWQMMFSNGGGLGTADIDADYIDTDQLAGILSSALTEFNPSPRPTTQIATQSATQPTTQPDPRVELQRMAQFQPIRKLAEQSNLMVSVNAHSCRAIDPRSGILHHLKNLTCRLDLGKGEKGTPRANLQFWSQVSDGQMDGDFTAELSQENPDLLLVSNLDNIKMTPDFKPLVEDFFPGLNVTDRMTSYEKNTCKMFTTPGAAPNYQAGVGKMEFLDGYMVGRAAPEWVTQIFPGLNFTRYRFYRMHNWFTKKSDGVVHNNMIFLGQPWNIYIEGNSRPGGYIEYEIGVDVFARFESEYWSSVGQGRIPILTTTARIVKGKMTNQVTRYVPAQDLFFRVFVKNNAITGAYRLLRRQLGYK